jgi:hypothetical protein
MNYAYKAAALGESRNKNILKKKALIYLKILVFLKNG